MCELTRLAVFTHYFTFSALPVLLCVAVVYYHWYGYSTVYFYTFLPKSIWITSLLFSVISDVATRSCTCLV